MTFVLVAVGGIVLGGVIALLVLRRRRPASLEKGLTNFQRGLEALDPANDPLKRAQQKKNR